MGIENPLLESIINIQQFANGTTLYSQDENDLETALNISGSSAKMSGLRVSNTQNRSHVNWQI